MEELPTGSQVVDRRLERRQQASDTVESLSHLESATFDAVVHEQSQPAQDLRQQLDLARMKLYATVDKVRGAEASRAAALGRIAEVEYHLHLREVEVASLQAELEAAKAEASSLRLAVARRARDTLRRSLGGKG